MTTHTTIAVIDYGMGNLHSVAKALEHADTHANVKVTSDKNIIANADRVLLPGVGAMRDCMGEMERLDLIDIIKQAAANKPFLGICIGMQALMRHSEENEGVNCLDLIPGNVVRFADDFTALCRTRQEADAVFTKIQTWVEQNRLCLHPDKTRVVNCVEKGQGFDFLGYQFEAGRRWVRPKSRKALRDKIREKTGRTRSDSLETIIRELNPILKGWFGYFKHAHRTTFRDVDGFVRRRLRAILRKRENRPGFGRTERDHFRWPNAFFAEHGLFTLHEAHVLASQPR